MKPVQLLIGVPQIIQSSGVTGKGNVFALPVRACEINWSINYNSTPSSTSVRLLGSINYNGVLPNQFGYPAQQLDISTNNFDDNRAVVPGPSGFIQSEIVSSDGLPVVISLTCKAK